MKREVDLQGQLSGKPDENANNGSHSQSEVIQNFRNAYPIAILAADPTTRELIRSCCEFADLPIATDVNSAAILIGNEPTNPVPGALNKPYIYIHNDQDNALPPHISSSALDPQWHCEFKLVPLLAAIAEASSYCKQLDSNPEQNLKFQDFVGTSQSAVEVRELMAHAAERDVTVLITGESGTGKEVVARLLHQASHRADWPFVPINCGAIPAELLESELFGHEKGAFTGAISHKTGRFELAHGGTLFLDEIGDLPFAMQVKLLRAIEHKSFERVGGTHTKNADVRIVAATNLDLESKMASGEFREDLYYRLNVFPIELTPLRERSDDLKMLIDVLVARIEQEQGLTVRFSMDAIALLESLPWPGNVRELANLLQRLAIQYPNSLVRVEDLPKKYSNAQRNSSTPTSIASEQVEHRQLGETPIARDEVLLPVNGLDLKDYLTRLERSLIQQALDDTNSVVARAADRLHIRRTTLVEKMRKHGLARTEQYLMIAVIANAQDKEAQRIARGLNHSGINAHWLANPLLGHQSSLGDIRRTLNSQDATVDSSIALIHVTQMDRLMGGLPDAELIAFGGEDSASAAVQSMQKGATSYLPKGVSIDEIRNVLATLAAKVDSKINSYSIPEDRPTDIAVNGIDGRDVVTQSTKLDNSANLQEDIGLNPTVATSTKLGIFHSPAMQKTLWLAQRAATSDISVMISGDSGTGKEVLAKFLHEQSPRSNKPYVAINCAAIPETMLEAVLFGHEKGTFTGANERRLGKFELADGGTLLLDEITEMPISLQAKLLRVLQEKEVERIGGKRPQAVDVRVIATSNRDLRKSVSDGLLREDLYYRLSVFPLHVAELADRREDILPLATHFLEKHGPAQTFTMDKSAEQILLNYTWPGNVRELENTIQRAIVMSNGNVIRSADLLIAPVQPTADRDNLMAVANVPKNDPQHQYNDAVITQPEGKNSLQDSIRSTEEDLLLQALRDNGGVRKKTALQLGLSERTLRYKLKKLRDKGIEV